jgi:hypothetical protein
MEKKKRRQAAVEAEYFLYLTNLKRGRRCMRRRVLSLSMRARLAVHGPDAYHDSGETRASLTEK